MANNEQVMGDRNHIENERRLMHSSCFWKEFRSKMMELQVTHFWVKKRQYWEQKKRVWSSGCHTTFCFDENDHLYKVKI